MSQVTVVKWAMDFIPGSVVGGLVGAFALAPQDFTCGAAFLRHPSLIPAATRDPCLNALGFSLGPLAANLEIRTVIGGAGGILVWFAYRLIRRLTSA